MKKRVHSKTRCKNWDTNLSKFARRLGNQNLWDWQLIFNQTRPLLHILFFDIFALFFTFKCITLISNHIPFKIIIKKSFIGKSEAARTKFTMGALVSKLKCLKEKVVARNSSKSGELWECYYHNKIFDCLTVETMLGVVLNLVAITQQISIDEKYICWKK